VLEHSQTQGPRALRLAGVAETLTPSPSQIRQVPDNQEVWIDKDGFTSIIFDITERVGSSGGGLERDGRALTTHLEDLVGDDADAVKVWNTTETQFTHLECAVPIPNLPRYLFPLLTESTTATAYQPTPSSRRRPRNGPHTRTSPGGTRRPTSRR
jgi:hypothetical protein